MAKLMGLIEAALLWALASKPPFVVAFAIVFVLAIVGKVIGGYREERVGPRGGRYTVDWFGKQETPACAIV